MKRRDFLSMLIGASTASIVLPKRVFSLPLFQRPYTIVSEELADNLFDINPYLTSKDAWFLNTEHADGLVLYARQRLHDQDLRASPFSNSSATAVDLSEESLTNMVIELRKLTDDRGNALTIKPTRRIVSPDPYPWIMSRGK